jgi:hypothetical protein
MPAAASHVAAYWVLYLRVVQKILEIIRCPNRRHTYLDLQGEIMDEGCRDLLASTTRWFRKAIPPNISSCTVCQNAGRVART